MAGKIRASGSGKFDPSAHLEKQGWKGKGTALKHGHAVRPLATVQKKTLSGIGKDRDLAVPFWDQIFASTAASLSLPGSDASSPAASHAPLIASSTAHQSTLSWQTLAPHGSPVPSPPPPKPKASGLSTQVRIGRETARRGLYGRFYRGEVLKHEEVVEEVEEIEAGPSTLPSQSPEMEGEKEVETKKDKKIKKERKEKADKEKEKEGKKKKRTRDQVQAEEAEDQPGKSRSSKKRRKETDGKEGDGTVGTPAESETKEERRARKKEKKRLKEAIAAA